MKNKLYIWEDVLTDYTDGLVVAFAPNIKEAIKQVKKAGLPDYHISGSHIDRIKPRIKKTPTAVYVYGGG